MGKKKKCKTCKLINFYLLYEPPIIGMIHVIKFKLVQETWKDNIHRGSITGFPHKLNYCPECGKRIEKTTSMRTEKKGIEK